MLYPKIDPIALKIGPFKYWEGLSIRWYGLTYLIGIGLAFFYCWAYRLKTSPIWTTDEIVDVFFYCVIGVIFGGSIGYVLFYEPKAFIEEPLRIFQFWLPGRSFHGGLLGVIVALLLYAKRHHRNFWAMADFLAPSIPLGLGAGRIGNFINGELWGRVTNVSWGMIFPHAGPLPRHPSQLYEFLLEGVVLFLVLHFYARMVPEKDRPVGHVSALFFLGYGLARFSVEFFREPDLYVAPAHWTWLRWFTMGQLLSLPMILFGIGLWMYGNRGLREGKRNLKKHKR